VSEGYQALREAAAWLDLSTRGRMIARGRDRARLLHNITTNEVKKMTPGSCSYAFLLSPQGRIQADLYLICLAEHFLIDTEPDLRQKVFAHILKYRVADQVELEDITASTAAIGVEGPAALRITLPEGDFLQAQITLTGQPGFRVYCAAERKDEMIARIEQAGVRPAILAEARVVRIENGKPAWGEDIRETSLPQETQQMQAISFTKGCYIGQEIVERIRAQGHVNRKLERIELEDSQPVPPGTQLTVNGRAAEITSSVYSPCAGKLIALAYVRTS
jgi:folate-binding protein YgfZ